MHRKPSRSVEHAQDLDGLAPNPVGHDVSGLQHDEFTRPRDSPWPPRARLPRQHRNRVKDALNDKLCGLRAIGLYSPQPPIHPGRWGPIGASARALVATGQDPKGDPQEHIHAITPALVLGALER